MRTVLRPLVVAITIAAIPTPCFALWDSVTVTKELARELGMEVQSQPAGPNHVQVRLSFDAEGKLKHFSQVDLRLGTRDSLALSVGLREDRSKPGRVTVGLTADQAQLDKLTLQVSVPFRDGGAGGTRYEIRVKDFVEPKKGR